MVSNYKNFISLAFFLHKLIFFHSVFEERLKEVERVCRMKIEIPFIYLFTVTHSEELNLKNKKDFSTKEIWKTQPANVQSNSHLQFYLNFRV